MDSLWLWWLWSFRLVYLVLVVAFFLGLEGGDKHVVPVAVVTGDDRLMKQF